MLLGDLSPLKIRPLEADILGLSLTHFNGSLPFTILLQWLDQEGREVSVLVPFDVVILHTVISIEMLLKE